MLSVIVPVLNEESQLPAFLSVTSTWDCDYELIFSDGGSTDATLDILRGYCVVTGAHGRGAQCLHAVRHAHGDALVFVHVDSVVSAEAMRAISAALARGVTWGCLTMRFDSPSFILAIGAYASNARVRLSGVPFGDQVIFVAMSAYDAVGGMPDIPLMEDYELARRLRRLCWPTQLKERVYTSARRFERGGCIRTMVQMRKLRSLYRRGVDAGELARVYYGDGNSDDVR